MIEILDFYDDWCSACKALNPILEEAEKKYPKAKIKKIKVSDNPEKAREYGVMGLPCIIILKNGEQVERFNNFIDRKELFWKIEENV